MTPPWEALDSLGALLALWGALSSLLGALGAVLCRLLVSNALLDALLVDFRMILGPSRDASTLDFARHYGTLATFLEITAFLLRCSSAPFLAVWGVLWRPSWGPSCPLLASSWALLGRSWAALGHILVLLGGLLALSGAVGALFGRSWALLGALGPLLGRSWPHLGALGWSLGTLGHSSRRQRPSGLYNIKGGF